MKKFLLLCLLCCAVTTGCKLKDENPHWNPKQDYADWTYDAPFYYRPTNDLKPYETIGKNIPVFYTKSKWFFIKHPGNCQLVGDPRVAIWYSSDEGETWEKAGFYGVEQTHFLFEAEEDGRYWIRFVGPGQKTAKGPVPEPHKVYVVDSEAPKLALAVFPAPVYEECCEEKTYYYRIGEEITLGWKVTDPNLVVTSIKLESCVGKAPYELTWMSFRGSLPAEGNRKVVVPVEAAKYGNFRFRLEAEDKAGNTAVAMTIPLPINKAEKAKHQTTTAPSRQADSLMPSIDETIIKRPGWPDAGTLYMGGTKHMLKWMPEFAKAYDGKINLQISINNSLTWKDLATKLSYGDAVEWTVPEKTSRFCRMRLIAIEGDEIIMLARSPLFRLSTPTDGSATGPEVMVKEKVEKKKSQ